jgi:hypothetical protein
VGNLVRALNLGTFSSGSDDGLSVGVAVARAVGFLLALSFVDGPIDGGSVGDLEGRLDGLSVGACDGAFEG